MPVTWPLFHSYLSVTFLPSLSLFHLLVTLPVTFFPLCPSCYFLVTCPLPGPHFTVTCPIPLPVSQLLASYNCIRASVVTNGLKLLQINHIPLQNWPLHITLSLTLSLYLYQYWSCSVLIGLDTNTEVHPRSPVDPGVNRKLIICKFLS